MPKELDMSSKGIYIPFYPYSTRHKLNLKEEEYKTYKRLIIRMFRDPSYRMSKLITFMREAEECKKLRQENEELRAALSTREQLVTAAYLVIATSKESSEEESEIEP